MSYDEESFLQGIVVGASIDWQRRKATNCLRFSSPESFSISHHGLKSWDGILEYSQDGVIWKEWDGSEIASKASNEIFLRGKGNTVITGVDNPLYPSPEGGGVYYDTNLRLMGRDISCEGNLEVLLDYVEVARGAHPAMERACFAYLFNNQAALIQAPDLLADALTNACCSHMYAQCHIIEPPILAASSLAGGSCNAMFYRCLWLKSAVILQAQTLGDSCCRAMYSHCEDLETAYVPPAQTLKDYCYNNMFYACTSLKAAPQIPADTLARHCCDSMFYYCSNLETACVPPATVMEEGCYEYMYRYTSITESPVLPGTKMAGSCYLGMFYGCEKLKMPPALPSVELAEQCYSSMFYLCDKLEALPELPALDLPYRCYSYMFYTRMPTTYNYYLSYSQHDEYTIVYRVPMVGTAVDQSGAFQWMFDVGPSGPNQTYYSRIPIIPAHEEGTP